VTAAVVVIPKIGYYYAQETMEDSDTVINKTELAWLSGSVQVATLLGSKPVFVEGVYNLGSSFAPDTDDTANLSHSIISSNQDEMERYNFDLVTGIRLGKLDLLAGYEYDTAVFSGMETVTNDSVPVSLVRNREVFKGGAGYSLAMSKTNSTIVSYTLGLSRELYWLDSLTVTDDSSTSGLQHRVSLKFQNSSPRTKVRSALKLNYSLHSSDEGVTEQSWSLGLELGRGF
jgi:hypothetical protein